MKIGYNFNNRLTIQEVSEMPNFECIEITPEIEASLQTMYIPLLVDGVVVESANISELKAMDLTNRINKAFTLLRQRALASSIGKSISFGFEYIKEQSEQYTYKYDVAIGNVEDSFVNSMIDNEANDFGINPEQMRQLIIDRYLQGKGVFMAYTSMIERARTKALTMIEISDFEKAEQITLMMENVPTEMTLEDAEILTNQMLSI